MEQRVVGRGWALEESQRRLLKKIIEGKARESASLEVDAELEASDMPPPKELMLRDQKNGTPLGAKEIYEEDYKWLKKMGCDKAISPALVQQHAMCVARWIQCENAIPFVLFQLTLTEDV